jgi:hypothetical protein
MSARSALLFMTVNYPGDTPMPTIHQEVTFAAPPARLYKALMTSADHAKFTGAPAEISEEVGGAWSAYGGKISGRNIRWSVLHTSGVTAPAAYSQERPSALTSCARLIAPREAFLRRPTTSAGPDSGPNF